MCGVVTDRGYGAGRVSTNRSPSAVPTLICGLDYTHTGHRSRGQWSAATARLLDARPSDPGRPARRLSRARTTREYRHHRVATQTARRTMTNLARPHALADP